jgi:hypothetical protein
MMCGYSFRNHAIRDIAHHDRASANGRPRADGSLRHDRRSDPDQHSYTDANRSGEMTAGREMGKIRHLAIVIDAACGIEDDVSANRRRRLHNRPGADNSTFAKHDVLSNEGSGMNYRRPLHHVIKSVRDLLPDAVVPNRDHGSPHTMVSEECVGHRPKHRHAKNVGTVPRRIVVEHTGDVITHRPRRIDNHLCVPATAEYREPGHTSTFS